MNNLKQLSTSCNQSKNMRLLQGKFKLMKTKKITSALAVFVNPTFYSVKIKQKQIGLFRSSKTLPQINQCNMAYRDLQKTESVTTQNMFLGLYVFTICSKYFLQHIFFRETPKRSKRNILFSFRIYLRFISKTVKTQFHGMNCIILCFLRAVLSQHMHENYYNQSFALFSSLVVR